jgi:hypothetical protein
MRGEGGEVCYNNMAPPMAKRIAIGENISDHLRYLD